MIEQKVNILSPKVLKTADAVCFTSNGIIKSGGELVMGAGIAKQFRDRFELIAERFGALVKSQGNHVYFLKFMEPPNDVDYRMIWIVSFPTKHHWRNDSDLELIKQSANELMTQLNNAPFIKTVYLPRPGVGLGGLSWEKEVRPAIEKILDNRVIVTSL